MIKDTNNVLTTNESKKISAIDPDLLTLFGNLASQVKDALIVICLYFAENRDTKLFIDEDAIEVVEIAKRINTNCALEWLIDLTLLCFRYNLVKQTSPDPQKLILETNKRLTDVVYQMLGVKDNEPEARDIKELIEINYGIEPDLEFLLNKFNSFLNEVANSENGGVAKFILAFVDGNNLWNWLEESSEDGFVLATYIISHSHTALPSDKDDPNAFENTVKELQKTFDLLYENKYQLTNETISTLSRVILEDIVSNQKVAHSLEKENERLKHQSQLLETKRESERKMLSFLTHTLRNSLASGPQELKQVIGFIGTEEYENNNKKYSAINTLVSQLSTFAHLDTLISTFKQIVGDKESFHRQWQNDTKGASNVGNVIKMCLRQLISRALFFPNYQRVIQRLMGDKDLNKLKFARKDYLQNVLSSEASEIESVDITGWAESFLPKLEISISDDSPNFGTHETKYIFLFSIFSELIWNAFKYADNENAISIEWSKAEDVYQFKVVNHCRGNQNSMALSTNKGLDFIQHLLQLHQGTSLKFGKDEHLKYSAEISFPIETFK